MSDLKTIKLPVELVSRLAALSMSERVAVIEKGLAFRVSSIEREASEPSPAPVVSPAIVEPVAVPEPASVVAEPSSVAEGNSFAGFSAPDPAPDCWVDYTIRVPSRAFMVLEKLNPQERAAVVDYTLAVAADFDHAKRIALLSGRFMWTAWETSRLLEVFQSGTPRAPRLERRLRTALHGWASSTLAAIGMPHRVPPLEKPPGITVAKRQGVPGYFELFGLWLPYTCAYELEAIQGRLAADYASPLTSSEVLREECGKGSAAEPEAAP